MRRKVTILIGIIAVVLLFGVVLPAIGHYRRVHRGAHVEDFGASVVSPDGRLKCIVSTVGPGQGKERHFRVRLHRMPEMDLVQMLELKPSDVSSSIGAAKSAIAWNQDSTAAVVTIADEIVIRCTATEINRQK